MLFHVPGEISAEKNLRDKEHDLKKRYKLGNFCHSPFMFKSLAQMKWRYQLSEIIGNISFVIKL